MPIQGKKVMKDRRRVHQRMVSRTRKIVKNCKKASLNFNAVTIQSSTNISNKSDNSTWILTTTLD